MASRRLRLFVVDVDGTLLTPDKTLTRPALEAVHQLRAAGVEVALTSGRPPRGLRMLIEPLALTTPLAGFNGGMFAAPDLTILHQRTLTRKAAREVSDLMRDHGLDVWVYRGQDWFVSDPNAPHVDRESRTVEFGPEVVDHLDDVLDQAVKIVGVSDDLAAVERCESDAQHLGSHLSAARSQPYYLDATHPDANKGAVVDYLIRHMSISAEQVATIGDMPNDVQMFEASRMSIAMGNASDEVKHRATYSTAANTEEGFARAVERLVLPATRGEEPQGLDSDD
jgi:Cof subfamily protein (haloacid dehalogenase superfamily)